MKKIISLSFLALGLLFWVACGNEASHQHDEKAAQAEAAAPQPGEGPISLNNGERWEANPETTEGIQNMKRIIDEFEPSEDVEAYRQLNQQLLDEFETIFRKCTMTGEAHNQLHNYLVPMKQFFSVMESAGAEGSQAAVEEMRATLERYEEFFM